MAVDNVARGMAASALNGGGGGGGGGSSTLSGLTDVDISNPTDGQTLVYNSTSGKWENGAGGLPAPTAADVGKVMSVVATPVPGAVIVPEQTVVWSEEYFAWIIPNGGNESLFQVGAVVNITFTAGDDIANVTTVVSEMEIVEPSRTIKAAISSTMNNLALIGIMYDDSLDMWVAYLEVDPEEGMPPITVSCSLAEYTYSWQPEPYIGYDVVIKLDEEIASPGLNDSKLHLLKGNYEECIRKMQIGQPVNAMVYTNMIGSQDGMTALENHGYVVTTRAFYNYGNFAEFDVSYGHSEYYRHIYLTESGLSLTPPWGGG